VNRKTVLSILAVSMVALLSPLIQPVFAAGCTTTCYLQANTNVPSSDAAVTVRLDNTTFFVLPHTFAFANGTIHTIEVMNMSLRGSSGSRYVWKQWDFCGSQWTPNSMLRTPLMMANYTSTCPFRGPFSADFTVLPAYGCNTNCYLDAQTSVPSTDGTIKVRADGGTVYSLSNTFAFANSTVHSLQVLNGTFTSSVSGARYVWKQWDCTCAGVSPTTGQTLNTPQMVYNYTFTESTGKNHLGGFTAEFDRQFQLTLTFTDSAGQPVPPPSSLTLQSGTTTVVLNSTSFSANWMSAYIWTVTDATWEGQSQSAVLPQTVDLTSGSISKTIQLRAYAETIRVVDQNSNAIPGVKLNITFSNSTSRAFTTDSQGMVQLGHLPAGSFTIHATYQGQAAGPWTTDASQSPNTSIQMNVASPAAASQTTAIVLLAIFAVAFVLILFAIKIKKAPGPPVIGKASS
jgi:hypothetical protein